jgi:hypothetical protein
LVSKLKSFFRIFRLGPTRPALDEKKLHETRGDAKTHDMLDGKGISPTGAVMDFESDAERPRH